MSATIDLTRAVAPWDERTAHYSDALGAAVRKSGVYVIIDARTRAPLYVGESHTGRLHGTITRHFRAWRIDHRRDPKGRRFGGTTYDRRRVLVAWAETPAHAAQDAQAALIHALKPRDNAVEPAVDLGDIPI